MQLYLVLFHVEDAHGAPIPGASAHAVNAEYGDWASMTNPCGDVIDPGSGLAGVLLSPGEYAITFSKPGYVDAYRDVTIVAEGPPIRVALERTTADLALPPIPSRAEVCGLQTSLAGLTYHTTQYGAIPAWFYGALNAEDRAIAREAHLAVNDTHVPFPITAAYREEGTLWPAELREGYDYTQDLETFRALLTETIAGGLFVDVPLGGDGLGMGPDYNDPVGRTYGFGWLMQNLARILGALQGDGTPDRPDLTPYIIFRPGWDACFYGWDGAETSTHGLRWRYVHRPRPTPTAEQLDAQQQRVKTFGEHFRSLLPEGYLAIEHTPGNIPAGEGGGDYAPGGLMTTYDTILSEFNTVHEDSCWQIVGRMVSPYHRPPDQPAGDDPHPPFYLAPGSPRGPYFYCAFEPTDGGAYEWCRGRCTVEDVNTVRAYLRDLGCTYTG